jgi:hypothetical protein
MELRDGRLKDENDWLGVQRLRNGYLLAKDCDYKTVAPWGAAVCAASAFLPFVKCVSSASAFQHQGHYTVSLVTDFFTGIVLSLFTRQAALGALQTYTEPVVLKGA